MGLWSQIVGFWSLTGFSLTSIHAPLDTFVSMFLSTSIVSGQMLLSIRTVSMLLSTSIVSGQMLLSIRIVSMLLRQAL